MYYFRNRNFLPLFRLAMTPYCIGVLSSSSTAILELTTTKCHVKIHAVNNVFTAALVRTRAACAQRASPVPITGTCAPRPREAAAQAIAGRVGRLGSTGEPRGREASSPAGTRARSAISSHARSSCDMRGIGRARVGKSGDHAPHGWSRSAGWKEPLRHSALCASFHGDDMIYFR